MNLNHMLQVFWKSGWEVDSADLQRVTRLRHDFYEVEYFPENDRVRHTIHPEAREEILKRLFQPNHKHYAEEAAKGLPNPNKAGKKVKVEATKPRPQQ